VTKRSVFSGCILLLLLACQLYAQSIPDKFQRLLQQNAMQFSMPPGFVSTPVIENGDVGYDFAIKSSTTKLEIRYRIWPMNEAMQNDPKRNWIYQTMVETMGLNISNGQLIQTKQYPQSDVKVEFGADGGITGTVRTDSKFGRGYKICMISAIHRDNVGDAYAFFLCDDPNVLMKALFANNVYHALKFR
jgi:hypothetical protein